MRARTAGLEPDLVQPQDVGLGVASRRIADLAQRIHQRLELGRQFGKYPSQDLPAAARQAARQRAVGAAAHRDVIVDVDQLARKAVGEEAGDEQRHIAQALQAAFALERARRLERIGQHLHQRPEPHAVGGALEQVLRAREQRQQVDHVLLGLVLDCHMLVRQRALQCIVKVLAQARHRHYTVVVIRTAA